MVVKISCGCLNIKIHSKNDELQKINNLSQIGTKPPSHHFFSNPLAEVQLNLEGVTMVHKFLVKTETEAEWSIYHCLNCKMWSHASPQGGGGTSVLVNMHMRHDPELMSRLEQSADFSPLYRIVLESATDPHLRPVSVPSSRYGVVSDTLSSIQQQLALYLAEQKQAMEDRIRAYIDAQHETYSKLEGKVRRDKNLMISMVLSQENNVTSGDNKQTTTQQGATSPVSASSASRNDSAAAVSPTLTPFKVNTTSTPPPGKVTKAATASSGASSSALSARINKPPSTTGSKKRQAEDVFESDPMFDEVDNDEHQRSFYDSEDDNEDTDDSECGVPAGRLAAGSAAVPGSATTAQSKRPSVYSSSVPINMPAAGWGSAGMIGSTAAVLTGGVASSVAIGGGGRFGGNRAGATALNRRSLEEEDEDEYVHSEDIAASIKAMARSVHADGTEMFGELPRSRFKTDFKP